MTDSLASMDKDLLAINTMRTLAMDAVQKANSGHPGTPMALAPVAYELWNHRLRYDPQDPIWPDRDRFVLSCGHASMLLYSLLHLAQVQAVAKYEKTGKPTVSLEDIQKFRQLDSTTPGHPEYHLTTGVESTTGPLGQGVATSVGMAAAQRWMATRFNKPGFDIVDYNVYVICSDGDMMEGISNEAASLAGHLRLSNLCWIYDSNRISIEGSTELAFTEDVGTRFLGLGWNVVHLRDANDTKGLARALRDFDREAEPADDDHRREPYRLRRAAPAGHQGSAWRGARRGRGPAHQEILRLAGGCAFPRARRGVPDTSRRASARAAKQLSEDWKRLFDRYRQQYPELAREFDLMQKREMPEGWESAMPSFPADEGGIASRDSSGKVLNALAEKIPFLLGGAADLSPSTKTDLKFKEAGSFEPDNYAGRNFHFGIREHAMGAFCNGMALSKLRPYGSGFLIFSDYMRGSIRLSALMELPVVWVFTHDSIGVGEDGPTHQPVEHLASLRAMPGMLTVRPCDANEVAEAWRYVLGHHHAARRLHPLAPEAADARSQQTTAPPAASRRAPMCSTTRRRAGPRSS